MKGWSQEHIESLKHLCSNEIIEAVELLDINSLKDLSSDLIKIVLGLKKVLLNVSMKVNDYKEQLEAKSNLDASNDIKLQELFKRLDIQ